MESKYYNFIIRSKIDYGCIVYESELDIAQAHALKICFGAIRTSPACVLQVEAGEMPLWLRQRQVTTNYCIDLRRDGDNHLLKKGITEMLRKGEEK